MNTRQNLLNTIILTVMLGLGLAGCGHKSEGGATQVVAKVNGDEISIHQVNFQLARLGALDKEKSKLAAKEVLSKLVNQELLKQKAVEAKLDRDLAYCRRLRLLRVKFWQVFILSSKWLKPPSLRHLK